MANWFDHVGAGQCGGPVIIVELAGVEMRVRRAVRCRGVVAIVVVRGLADGAKAAILILGQRHVVVMPEQHRFAIAHLQQRRRQQATGQATGAEGPDLVIHLQRKAGVKGYQRIRAAQRHQIALFGQVFEPALMGEIFAWRATLHRAAPGEGIGIERVATGGGIFRVPGRAFGIGFVGKPVPLQHHLIALGDRGQIMRQLFVQARHGLGEGRHAIKRAARGAGGDGGKDLAVGIRA